MGSARVMSVTSEGIMSWPEVRNRLRAFRNDELAALHSVEFLLVGSIVCLGVIVGLAEYRNAVVQELGDVSGALAHLDQSFTMDLVNSGGGFTTVSNVDAMNYSSLDANGIVVTTPGSVE